MENIKNIIKKALIKASKTVVIPMISGLFLIIFLISVIIAVIATLAGVSEESDEAIGSTSLDYSEYSDLTETTSQSLARYLQQFSSNTDGEPNNIGSYYQNVVSLTQGLNLSQQQLWALTTINYHLEQLPTVNGKNFSEVYREAKIQEQQYQYIWDNWWYNSYDQVVYPIDIKRRDAAFETFVKGTYDFSSNGGVFERTELLYYTSDQLGKLPGGHGNGLKNQVTRSIDKEQQIFTYENNSQSINIAGNASFLEVAKICHDYLAENQYFYSSQANKQANRYINDGVSAGRNIPVQEGESIKYIDCSAYVTWVLYKYGYTELKGWQKTSSWFMTNCITTYPSWKKVSITEAQPGDILAKNGHVEIYAGDGKVYNCGSTSAIRAKEPTSQSITSITGIAIRVTKKR